MSGSASCARVKSVCTGQPPSTMRPGLRIWRGSNASLTRRDSAASGAGCGSNTGDRAAQARRALDQRRMAGAPPVRRRGSRCGSSRRRHRPPRATASPDEPAAPIEKPRRIERARRSPRPVRRRAPARPRCATPRGRQAPASGATSPIARHSAIDSASPSAPADRLRHARGQARRGERRPTAPALRPATRPRPGATAARAAAQSRRQVGGARDLVRRAERRRHQPHCRGVGRDAANSTVATVSGRGKTLTVTSSSAASVP